MMVDNTMFLRKNIYKYTWVSPDQETCNKINHILIDAQHTSNLTQVRTMRDINIDSDHLVKATIRSSIQEHNNPEGKKR